MNLTELPNVDFTVNDMLNRVGRFKPDFPALQTVEHSRTFGDLIENARKVAAWMISKGAKKGDRVLLLGLNSIELVEVFFACAKSGLIAVPLNLKSTEKELEYIVGDCTPTFMFADNPIDSRWNETNDLIKISFNSRSVNYYEYSEILQNAKIQTFPHVSSDDDFLILYTAAVEGNPKGARQSHQNVISSNIQTFNLLEGKMSDVFGIFTPLNHIAGTSLLFAGLHVGITNVLLAEFDPDLIIKLIQKNKISVFCSFSPMTQRIMESALVNEVKLEENVRCIFGLDSSENIQNVISKGIDWYGVYSQTEITGLLMTGKVTNAKEQVGYIGTPGFFTDIYILDEDGNQVELGQVGELCVKGLPVFKGYWNRPDDNRWVFRGGLLHTGDLIMTEGDGHYWYRGRLEEKELIKTGGENVYPEEIEQTILQMPEIKYVCVIGVPDPVWLETVKAVIQLNKDAINIDEEHITNFCKKYLARFKIPKILEFVNEMPIENGKVDRTRVKELYTNNK